MTFMPAFPFLRPEEICSRAEFDASLFRPQERRWTGSGGDDGGTDGERAGDDKSPRRHGHDDPWDYDRIRQHTNRPGELLPNGPSNSDPDRHTDDEADECDRCRLP